MNRNKIVIQFKDGGELIFKVDKSSKLEDKALEILKESIDEGLVSKATTQKFPSGNNKEEILYFNFKYKYGEEDLNE